MFGVEGDVRIVRSSEYASTVDEQYFISLFYCSNITAQHFDYRNNRYFPISLRAVAKT